MLKYTTVKEGAVMQESDLFFSQKEDMISCNKVVCHIIKLLVDEHLSAC